MIMSFCRSGKPSELLERVRERVRERKKAEDEGRVFSPNPPPSPQPPPSSSATAAARSNQATVGGGGFKLGSSKDLAPSDPFASTAPRAEFKNGRANGKGKGRALVCPFFVLSLQALSSCTMVLTRSFQNSATTHSKIFHSTASIIFTSKIDSNSSGETHDSLHNDND